MYICNFLLVLNHLYVPLFMHNLIILKIYDQVCIYDIYYYTAARLTDFEEFIR